MSDEIAVKVHSYGPGRSLALVYFDPVSGRKKAKSAKTTEWREAERAAAELEKELRAGRYAPPSKVTWGQFVDRYTQEKLLAVRLRTRQSALESLGKLNALFSPDRLVKVNAALLSRFQAEMRKPRKVKRGDKEITLPPFKETTIAHHLRHVKAALRWAERQGMLGKAPAIEMPKAAKGQSLARSRAVTTEEYERMLSATCKVRPKDAVEWERLITGVWLSGLRLGESVVLSWDEGATFSVDLSGKRPCLRILAEGQKSGRDEVLPMTPDFAEFLLTTPEAERVGRVFRLLDQGTGSPVAAHRVCRIVSKIGRKANVVTNKAEGKYAGLHDLRRAFGTRWAQRVRTPVLQKLMRHASIQITLAYYVTLDADEVADELWAKHTVTPGNTTGLGNKSGNNGHEVSAAADEANTI